jgi:site-specific DNA recombinase
LELQITVRRWLRAGIELHFCDIGQVKSETDIVLIIRGWAGGEERSKILERSMRGKREKLARGMVVGGTVAFGYAHERDVQGRIINLRINEDEAPVIRLIFQWYTVGDGDHAPLTLYEIARRMQAAGVRTRTRKAPWSVPMVSRILSNATYKGMYTYHCKETDETFTVSVPALVDAATWDAAQGQKVRNSCKAKRNAKRDYLLTGIIKCECGRSMSGAGTQEHYYYYCSSRTSYRKAERPCNAKGIPAAAVEAAAWGALLERIESSETLEADLREAQRRENAEREPQRAELEAVIAMMGEAEKDAATLADSLNALGDKRKGLVAKTLQDRIDAVDARYHALAQRLDELEAALSKRRYTDEAIKQQMEFMADLRAGLADPDHAAKRAILDRFNARVIVKDGKPRLCYTMPDEVSIDLHLSLQTQVNYNTISIPLDLAPYLSQATPQRNRRQDAPTTRAADRRQQ